MLCQQNTRRGPVLQSCSRHVELRVPPRPRVTHHSPVPPPAPCHPPQPGAAPPHAALPLSGGIPEDPAVTPRRLPVNSCAVRCAMAARQDPLAAPNRAIPGPSLPRWRKVYPRWAPAGEQPTQGWDSRSNPLDLHPSSSWGHTRLILTGGRGSMSCCGVKPEDGSIPLPRGCFGWQGAGVGTQWDRAGWHQQGPHGQSVHGHRLRVPWAG